jgi:hypothetical protein
MKREVFLSILSMDSYHRDPNSEFQVQGNLGNASFLGDSSEISGSANSGFFASAYDWNGEKIISYAGTNDLDS